MNKPVKAIPCEHGVVIKIYQDTDAQSPNDYDGDCCFLWSDDRDLCLIERKDGQGARRVKGVSKGDLMRDEDDDCSTPTEYAVFPVGVGYHADCLSSFGSDISSDNDAIERNTAFILVRRADFPPGHDLRAAARACFDEWNTYLDGDVYGFVVEDAEGEELHSCWGFYGLDYCIGEAREAAESHMPVARGRALLKNAADDVQRRLAHPPNDYPGLTWAADAIGGSLWAADTNGDVLAAVGRECQDYDKEVHSEAYPYIVAVTAAWRDRYWPGD